jgi:transcriptional regulator with XRE-family HTH domain
MADVLPFPKVRPDTDPSADPAERDRPLREERLDQERTLADVADVAHVSLPYLSDVERGLKDVSSDVLGAICEALELPLADVLERSAERLRPTTGGGSGVMLLAA